MSSSQVSSSYISLIYKSRKILLELMKKQGYNTEEYNNFSISEVSIMSNNKQLDMFLEKNDDSKFTTSSNKMYICYNYYSHLTQKNIRETITDLYIGEEEQPKLEQTDTLLFITKEDPNETIMNELIHIWEVEKKFIVIISIKRLQFNILDHALVPAHRVLSKEETVNIMKKYNMVDINQFPEISRFDPVSLVIGIKPNEICEIYRPSKTTIHAFYYRVCT
jgi:DNA-directed RNA polymerase subunit H